ncbi:MAG TPA: hypothetical protein VML95_03185 [Longimicrobiales bacterium]|nr:hypothetical protein [Longimicrobiales bacterium]
MESTIRDRSLLGRMLGAARLDVAVYEDVEHDTSATAQAGVVVGLVAVATAVGGLGGSGFALFGSIVAAYAGWLLWSGVVFLIGQHLMNGTATWGEVLRTVGFAQSPGVLYALAFLPLLGGLISGAVWVWLLLAVFVAVRQALDVSSGAALLTVLLGWIPYVILQLATRILTGVWPNLI